MIIKKNILIKENNHFQENSQFPQNEISHGSVKKIKTNECIN